MTPDNEKRLQEAVLKAWGRSQQQHESTLRKIADHLEHEATRQKRTSEDLRECLRKSTFTAMLVSAVSIPALVIAAVKFRDCPTQELLPIALLCSALCLSLFGCTLIGFHWIRSGPNLRTSYRERHKLHVVQGSSAFTLGLWITAMVMLGVLVFRKNYCDPVVYWTSFTAVVLFLLLLLVIVTFRLFCG